MVPIPDVVAGPIEIEHVDPEVRLTHVIVNGYLNSLHSGTAFEMDFWGKLWDEIGE